jgi:Domain of unknown function (DUF4157)
MSKDFQHRMNRDLQSSNVRLSESPPPMAIDRHRHSSLPLGAEDRPAIRHEALNLPIHTKPIIQPKLTLGAPSDRYEQEADRIANAVVHHLQTPVASSVPAPETPKLNFNSRVQRSSMAPPTPMIPQLDTTIQRSRGQGQPLAPSIRQPMENAFGTDFSQVKIHTDTPADQMNRSIQAQAFTTGQDIFMRANAYQPQTTPGQTLLAHELTHVVQQNQASQNSQPSSVIQRKMAVNNAVVDFETAWAQIQASGVTPLGKQWTDAHKERLKIWVKRKAEYSPLQWYMVGQSWTFDTWAEAAQELDHNVVTRVSRQKEKDLAEEARKSDRVRSDLVTAMTLIGTWISNTYPGQMAINGENQTIWNYLENFKGQYRTWYPNGSIQTRMMTPKYNGVSSNFVILREIYYALYSLFSSGESAIDVVPHGPRYGTGIDTNTGLPTDRVRIDKGAAQGETRRDDLTPNPDHPWVQAARFMAMPLGAGASNTTDRLLYMAGLAGVGKAGKTAIAWGGFVFWNKRYFKIFGSGHTFHEVMDVAAVEHGVEYTPGSYPDHAPQ